MPRLYQLDTYFQKLFIVTDAGVVVLKSHNWAEARDRYADLTGEYRETPSHDLAAELALLEGLASDAGA